MKESLWGYWIIILGIFILTVMMLFNNYTTTNEQDYILIKEVTEAPNLETEILEVGDGLAVSRLKSTIKI